MSANDIVDVLRLWADEKGNKKLKAGDIIKICGLLALLKSRATTLEDMEMENLVIYVPDEHGVLKSSKLLYYNDAPSVDKLEKYNNYFVHKSISRDIAKFVGVKMVESEILKNLKSKQKFPFASPYGQKEELITRIKNILDEYAGKIDVFKELLQNADDSGATEFNLILDKRDFSGHSHRVLNENSKFIQGPALIASNNKKFTEKDFIGLENLGTGSKRDDAESIGKFGIGFNTVYSITDTPMFISNDKFVILDPHLSFSEVGNASEPGGMFDIVPEFEAKVSDILRGFQFPGNLVTSLETVFRFPLRCGFESKISKDINIGENLTCMNEKLESFIREADKCILFLKNIRKINISVIEENGEVTKKKFIEKTIVQGLIPGVIDVNIKSERNETHYKVASSTEHSGSCLLSASVALNMKLIRSNIREKGQLFVGLPIKQEIELPVYISANFELDRGRNTLRPESQWNSSILSGVCTKAYILMMEEVKNSIVEHQKIRMKSNSTQYVIGLYGDGFHELFPRLMTEANCLFPLLKSFYSRIEDKKLVPCLMVKTSDSRNFKSYFSYHSIKECLFIDEKLQISKMTNEFNALMKLKVPVVYFQNVKEENNEKRQSSTTSNDEKTVEIELAFDLLKVTEKFGLQVGLLELVAFKHVIGQLAPFRALINHY